MDKGDWPPGVNIKISEYESLSIDLSNAEYQLEKDEKCFGKSSDFYKSSLSKYLEIKSRFDTCPKPPLISSSTRKEILYYIILLSSLILFSWYVTSHYSYATETVTAKVYLKDGSIEYREVEITTHDEWFRDAYYTRVTRWGDKYTARYTAFDRFFDLFIKLFAFSVAIRLVYIILRNNKAEHDL